MNDCRNMISKSNIIYIENSLAIFPFSPALSFAATNKFDMVHINFLIN